MRDLRQGMVSTGRQECGQLDLIEHSIFAKGQTAYSALTSPKDWNRLTNLSAINVHSLLSLSFFKT